MPWCGKGSSRLPATNQVPRLERGADMWRQQPSMVLVWVMCLLAVLLLVAQSAAEQEERASETSVGCPTHDSEMKMPDLSIATETSFEMAVEMVLPSDNRTINILEVHDMESLQGALVVANGSQEYRIIYDIESSQMFQMTDGQCTEQDLTSPSLNPEGWLYGSGLHYLYGPSALLRLSSTLPKRFIGETRLIRGVDVQQWQACNSAKDMFINFYLPLPEWDTPVSSQFSPHNIYLPVAVSIIPRAGNSTWEEVRYSFTSYQPLVLHHEQLQIPLGLSCPGLFSLDPSRKLPRFPNRFRMSVEAISNPYLDVFNDYYEVGTLSNYEIAYDAPHRLVEYEFWPEGGSPSPFHAQEPMRLVQDFNTGAAYLIDLVTGQCRTSPVSVTAVGDFIVSGRGHFMDQPDDFFHLNASFSYLGPSSERGVDVDLWTLTLTGAKVLRAFGREYQLSRLSIQHHFSSRDVWWEEAEDFDVGAILLRTDLFGYNNYSVDVVAAITLNVHDFSAWSDVDSGFFDVSPCFDLESQRIVFQLIFQWTSRNTNVSDERFADQFKREVFEAVLDVTEVSPVRLSNILLYSDQSSYISWQATLLERVPFTVGFVETENHEMMQGGGSRQVKGVQGSEECARLCWEEEAFRCGSFDLCGGGGERETTCLLSAQERGPLRLRHNCSHFDRSEDNSSTSDPFSADAMAVLRTAVASRAMGVAVEGGRLVATDVHVLGRSSPEQPSFQLDRRATRIAHAMHNTTAVSSAACERLCTEELSFECDSFSFCTSDNSCQLSSLGTSQNTSGLSLEEEGDCELHVRRSLSLFDLLPGGLQGATEGGKEVHGVEDPETCAGMCVAEKSFVCRSFDSCVLSRSCTLHPTHFLLASPSGTHVPSHHANTSCSHYERRALDDFRMFRQQTSWSTESVQQHLVGGMVAAWECAALCEQQQGDFVCRSFDLCTVCPSEGACQGMLPSSSHSGGLCLLSTLGADAASPRDFAGCDHYLRDYYEGKDAPEDADSGGSFSGAALAGIGLGMLVLGALLVVASMSLWQRLHRTPSPQVTEAMNLHFHNPMAEEPQVHMEATLQVVH